MKIRAFLNQSFYYLDNPKNKWRYILISTFFALIFLVLFQPYGISEEISNPVNSLFNISLFFLSITFSTFITLYISQFFARKWFGFENVIIKRYMLWFLLEAIGLTLVNFCFSFIVPDLGNDFEKELNLGFQIRIFFKISIVLLFPFVGTIIYILIEALNGEIHKLGTQLKNYQAKFSTNQKAELLEIKDENDNLDFSIELKDFLFAESSNQYVLIYYLKEGKVKKHIVRNRMKCFLDQTKNLPIKQSHRSYAINLLNIDHMVKIKGKDFLVNTKVESLKVPISKSFLDPISNEILSNKMV